ncbi:GNAT family N-acetyltransferase [Xenorhabdus budapestensis]|uniref:GCN5 family acetyltransferase n=1 Tax=Xenorhabdus budapestensis TaxID=290110 RepID=A0A2D0IY93_XENBU|nr:GNAT family N-acetyltransferase [Xenorhabdus budapestensis]PHM26922.1 GCN5 family acetyltransferase [Xenorhabdus budapestensis]QTL39258.1 GNAT family N-acetyltransferase [Xenorhabdus budapestensis]
MITLTDVNKNNYEAVCGLSVTDDQLDYIAENVWSLVQSKFYPLYQTRAICLDGEPVGFFMWVPDADQRITIWRFMVDKNHQNKGIGRKALSLALDEIRRTDQLEAIAISYDPNNLVAKNLYASFGFVEVGMDAEVEEMLAVIKI